MGSDNKAISEPVNSLKKDDHKLPISVFIIAQDEEANIARLLPCLRQFDEVIVVDSGSHDNTPAVAQSHGANLYRQNWLGYAAQKAYAMSKCRNQWVLNLDADEEISEAFITELKRIISLPKVNAARFERDDLFMGKVPPAWLKKPTNLRLYRKKFAYFDVENMVHESAKVSGQQLRSKLAFTHYGYNDIYTLVEKNNHYSSLKSLEKYQQGKSASLLKLVMIFPFEFLRKYLLQRYFTFGRRGLVLAIINAFYAFLKEAKLQEKYLIRKP